MVNKNQYNLPTYFQLGRNSIKNGESLFINDPTNQGLVGNFRGKKQDIPIAANLLGETNKHGLKGEAISLMSLNCSPVRSKRHSGLL